MTIKVYINISKKRKTELLDFIQEIMICIIEKGTTIEEQHYIINNIVEIYNKC